MACLDFYPAHIKCRGGQEPKRSRRDTPQTPLGHRVGQRLLTKTGLQHGCRSTATSLARIFLFFNPFLPSGQKTADFGQSIFQYQLRCHNILWFSVLQNLSPPESLLDYGGLLDVQISIFFFITTVVWNKPVSVS